MSIKNVYPIVCATCGYELQEISHIILDNKDSLMKGKSVHKLIENEIDDSKFCEDLFKKFHLPSCCKITLTHQDDLNKLIYD